MVKSYLDYMAQETPPSFLAAAENSQRRTTFITATVVPPEKERRHGGADSTIPWRPVRIPMCRCRYRMNSRNKLKPDFLGYSCGRGWQRMAEDGRGWRRIRRTCYWTMAGSSSRQRKSRSDGSITEHRFQSINRNHILFGTNLEAEVLAPPFQYQVRPAITRSQSRYNCILANKHELSFQEGCR